MLYRIILSLLLSFIFFSVIFSVVILHEKRDHEENIVAQSSEYLQQHSDRLIVAMQEVESDLKYLSHLNELRTFNGQANQKIANHLKNFSEEKQRYDQIRLINLKGQEVLRVDLTQSEAVIVPQHLLQDKSDRYYFKETRSLSEGKIYSSPFDLNIEGSEIEIPLKPMIRFVTPVTDYQGEKIGILVLNFTGKKILSQFRQLAFRAPGKSLLINSQGFYIAGFNPLHEWAFMFKNKTEKRFDVDFPEVWHAINNTQKTFLRNDSGIFSFTRLHRYLNSSLKGSSCGICNLGIVIYTSTADLREKTYTDILSYLPMFIINIFLLTLVLYGYFHFKEKQRKNSEIIQLLHGDISNERDLFVGGPTVIFKLKNEFGWPVEFVSENVKLILGYSVDDFMAQKISYAGIIVPDFLQQVSDELNHAKKKQLNWFEHQPYQVVKQNGQRIWLRNITTVIRNEQDKITHFYGYINDITELKNAEYQLQQSQKYNQLLIDTITDATLVIDINTYQILLANKSAIQTYMPFSKEKNLDITCHKLTHHSDQPCIGKDDPCPIKEVLSNKTPYKVLHKHCDAYGNENFIEVSASPIFDKNNNIVQIIESHHDVTSHIVAENKFKQLASTDKLTNIYNRHKFDEELIQQIKTANQNGSSLGLIMFDIDHFKNINDRYGHDTGDKVLQELVNCVRKRLRKSDVLARWGGEEFMLLMPDTNADQLERVAEDLRRIIENHKFSNVSQVTSSFGISLYSPGDTIENFLKQVDDTLYHAKETGRNRVCTNWSR